MKPTFVAGELLKFKHDAWDPDVYDEHSVYTCYDVDNHIEDVPKSKLLNQVVEVYRTAKYVEPYDVVRVWIPAFSVYADCYQHRFEKIGEQK